MHKNKVRSLKHTHWISGLEGVSSVCVSFLDMYNCEWWIKYIYQIIEDIRDKPRQPGLEKQISKLETILISIRNEMDL